MQGKWVSTPLCTLLGCTQQFLSWSGADAWVLCRQGQLQVLYGASGLYCAMNCSSPALVHMDRVHLDKERERGSVADT